MLAEISVQSLGGSRKVEISTEIPGFRSKFRAAAKTRKFRFEQRSTELSTEILAKFAKTKISVIIGRLHTEEYLEDNYAK